MAEQTDRVDIAVLGGGVTGGALALALARHGVSVALIDREPPETRAAPDFDGRAFAIAPGTANLLRAIGIWDAVSTQAEPILAMHVEDRAPGPVAPNPLDFHPSESAQGGLGWILETRWLRAALAKAVAEAPLIAEHAPARPDTVDCGPTGVRVHLDTGVTLRAALAVACDGRRSAIAREAGVRYLDWAYGQTGLVAAIEHTRPHDGVAHQTFYPGGPFAVLPLPGNRSSLVWSEKDAEAARLSALDDAAFTRHLALRIGGRLGEIALTGGRWQHPLGFSFATSFVAERLALAGDAAHGVHPIAGQGMNIGMRDVAALTEVVVEAMRIGEDIGTAPVLARYQQWRRFDGAASALGIDALNRLFSTGSAPVQALRNHGLGMVGRLGGVKRFFLAEASGMAGDAPALLVGRAI